MGRTETHVVMGRTETPQKRARPILQGPRVMMSVCGVCVAGGGATCNKDFLWE